MKISLDCTISAIIYCMILCNNGQNCTIWAKFQKSKKTSFIPHPKSYNRAKFHGNWVNWQSQDIIGFILNEFSWIFPYICPKSPQSSENHAHFEVLYLHKRERFLNSVKYGKNLFFILDLPCRLKT